MLGKESIQKYLDTTWAGSEIIYKDVTESTNTDACELAAQGAGHGTLVVADRQDRGRGSREEPGRHPQGATSR